MPHVPLDTHMRMTARTRHSHGTARYCTILHDTTRYCTILHDTAHADTAHMDTTHSHIGDAPHVGAWRTRRRGTWLCAPEKTFASREQWIRRRIAELATLAAGLLSFRLRDGGSRCCGRDRHYHRRARLASGVSLWKKRVSSWKKPMSGSQSSESARRCASGSRSRDPSLRLGAPGAMCSTSRRPREGVAGVSLRFSISSRSSKHRLAAPVGLIPLSTCRDSAWVSGHAPL